jgi:hypothetical protein
VAFESHPGKLYGGITIKGKVSANLEAAKTVAVVVPSAPVERCANVLVNVPRIRLIVTKNDN